MKKKKSKMPMKDMGFAEAEFPKTKKASKSKVAKMKKKPSATRY